MQRNNIKKTKVKKEPVMRIKDQEVLKFSEISKYDFLIIKKYGPALGGYVDRYILFKDFVEALYQNIGGGYAQQKVPPLSSVTEKGNSTPDDLELTDKTKGIILKSPDGNKWKLQPTNNGNVQFTKL